VFDQLSVLILETILNYLEPYFFVSFSMVSQHIFQFSGDVIFREKNDFYNLQLCFPGIPKKFSKIPTRNFSSDDKKILSESILDIFPHLLPIEISLGFCEELRVSARRLPEYFYRNTGNLHLLVQKHARIFHILSPVEKKLIPLGWEVKWRLVVQKQHRVILSEESWFYKHAEDLFLEFKESYGFLKLEVFLTPAESDA